MTLSNDDRCAVDIVLDGRSQSQEQVNTCFNAGPSLPQRIQRVDGLLHLLDHMRLAEPPADLAARTIARCEQRAATFRTPQHPVVTHVAGTR